MLKELFWELLASGLTEGWLAYAIGLGIIVWIVILFINYHSVPTQI